MFIFTSSENSLNAMLHEHAYMHDVLCFKKIITRISYINVIFLDAYIIWPCVYIVMIYLFLFQHPRKTFRYRSSPSLLFTRRMTWSSNAPLQTRHSSVLCITYNFIGTVAPALNLQYQYLKAIAHKFSGPRDQHYKTGPLQ